jgi:hypothetical protein
MLGVGSDKTRLNAWMPLPPDATAGDNDVLQALIVSPFPKPIEETLNGLFIEAQ